MCLEIFLFIQRLGDLNTEHYFTIQNSKTREAKVSLKLAVRTVIKFDSTIEQLTSEFLRKIENVACHMTAIDQCEGGLNQ